MAAADGAGPGRDGEGDRPPTNGAAARPRWQELVREFTGGDPGITKSLGRVWQEEPTVHGMDTGPMRQLMGYVQKAWEAGKAEK